MQPKTNLVFLESGDGSYRRNSLMNIKFIERHFLGAILQTVISSVLTQLFRQPKSVQKVNNRFVIVSILN